MSEMATSVRNGDSGLTVYKAAQLLHVPRGEAKTRRRRLVRFVAPPGLGDGKQKVTRLGQPDPAGAADPFLGPRAHPPAASPCHHFRDASIDPRRLLRGKPHRFHMVTFKELPVVEQDDGLRFPLD